jgi:hypothetical protein
MHLYWLMSRRMLDNRPKPNRSWLKRPPIPYLSKRPTPYQLSRLNSVFNSPPPASFLATFRPRRPLR